MTVYQIMLYIMINVTCLNDYVLLISDGLLDIPFI